MKRKKNNKECTLSNELREFLSKCIDFENFENNPILQDYMTPKTVSEIEQLLSH